MYQFIHIETYARQASTKQKPSKKAKANTDVRASKPKQNVSGVIAEAVRDEGNCPHIAEPQPPRYIVGNNAIMREMESDIERNLEAHHARTGGRKVRSDAHVLLAGVASFPRELQKTEPETYAKWERKTVEWLQEKYGDDLRCILSHDDDEEHPHIHFYVYSAEKVNAKELHDGYAAAVALPSMTKEAGIAHADAMREMQSAYYADVAHDCGLLRDGPKRRREPRDVYKARQREERERVALTKEVSQVHADLLNGAAIEAKAAAELRREAERGQQAALIAFGEVQFDRLELQHAREGMAEEKADFDEQRQGVQRDRAAVDAEWAKAREAHAAAARLESDAKRTLSTLTNQAAAMERARAAAEEAKAVAALATVARDREADELRTEKARAVAFSKKFAGQLAGLGAVEDVRALVRKPELAAMLEFIDQNPKAREVLTFMKTDPEMAGVLAENVEAYQAVGNGAQVAWEPSQQVSEGARYLAGLDEDEARANARKARDSGMDFGM